MAIALANSRDGEGRLSMASLGAVASIAHHKHQMFRHGYAGQTRRGCHVEAPVAPYELRDWMASRHAGFGRLTLFIGRGRRGSGPFSRILIGWSSPSRRPVRCPSRCIGHHLRVRAHVSAPLVFHSLRSAGCTRPRAQSLAHKQVIQAVAYGPHLSRLSSSASSAGFKTSWKALTNDEILFDAGSTSHD